MSEGRKWIKLNLCPMTGRPLREDGTYEGFSWAEFLELTEGMTTAEKAAYLRKRWARNWLSACSRLAGEKRSRGTNMPL